MDASNIIEINEIKELLKDKKELLKIFNDMIKLINFKLENFEECSDTDSEDDYDKFNRLVKEGVMMVESDSD